MPNIDPAAKAWELDLAARVGKAVQKRRNALKLTAQQLAQRTAELGYPVTRVAISKIESNKRAGKLDVAELLVLAAALDIPPVLLLFPDFPDGSVENLPGRDTESRKAVLWFSGQAPSEWVGLRGDYVWNPGEELVETDDLATATDTKLRQLQLELGRMLTARDSPPEVTEQVRRDIQHHEKLLATLRASAKRDKDELWGAAEEERRERRSVGTPGAGSEGGRR
jgi:transcriptional regulator with XRE-family HTH domain